MRRSKSTRRRITTARVTENGTSYRACGAHRPLTPEDLAALDALMDAACEQMIAQMKQKEPGGTDADQPQPLAQRGPEGRPGR